MGFVYRFLWNWVLEMQWVGLKPMTPHVWGLFSAELPFRVYPCWAFQVLLSFTRWVLHAVELQTLFNACRTSLTAFFFCCFFSGGYDRMSGFGLLCAFKGWFLESCVGLEQKTTTIWWFFGAQIWRGWPKLVSDWVFFFSSGVGVGFLLKWVYALLEWF